jgi:hypothetical protein
MMNIRVAGHGAWLPLLSRVVSIKAEGRRCGVNEQTDTHKISQPKKAAAQQQQLRMLQHYSSFVVKSLWRESLKGDGR